MRWFAVLLLCAPLAAQALEYEVEVDAPLALTPLLEANLDLFLLRGDPALQPHELDMMVSSTPAEIRSLLETEGYFAPQVSLQREGPRIRLSVQPGLPVAVTAVDVQLTGAIRDEPDLGRYLEEVMAGWSLPEGAVFRQSDWDDSKKAVLKPLLLERFPLARVATSQAQIDPQSRQARLQVVVDSGPRIVYGPLRVDGVSRYPESVIRGQAEFLPGQPYRQRDLHDLQASLEKDNHYSGVVVAPLWEARDGDTVPIGITVTEVARQKLDLGLNYSTGDGVGTRIGYEHYNIFRRGFTGSVVYDWKANRQALDLGLGFPRTAGGYSHAITLTQKHSETGGTVNDNRELGIFRIRQSGNIEARLGAEYVLERERQPQEPADFKKALVLSYGWVQRAVDNPLRPARGYLVEAQVAGTVGSAGADTRFQRGYLRLAHYWSPGWLRGTLVTRGEAGQVWAKDTAEVPASRLFKAGGANSVRGYDYQSLGVNDADGTVHGGRVLATGSIEYQYPVTPNWRAAVFVDSGDAALSWQALRPAGAYGIGARWLSPVAPLAFDLAHGERDGRWRWNLNLGLAF